MSNSATSSELTAAQKAQIFANQTVETARIEILKEPLGFIKILQFILALLAFSVAVSGGSNLLLFKNCFNSTNVEYRSIYNYPYDLKKAALIPVQQECTNEKFGEIFITKESNNIVSSAQFFVFAGITSFLYSIVFSIIYIFFRHKYNNIVYLPLIDLLVTCIFGVFWFAGSIAWSKAVGDIMHYTSKETLNETLELCKKNCQIKEPAYANLVVSCILGFGNLILWSGNVWFVFKETAWYKFRSQMSQQSTNRSNNPITPNDINITAHYNPN